MTRDGVGAAETADLGSAAPGLACDGTGAGVGDAPAGAEGAAGEGGGAGDAGPGGVVRPHYPAGDAIFFDQMNLHTTSGGPTMTKTRYAIESWWFSPSHYPMTTLPLMV